MLIPCDINPGLWFHFCRDSSYHPADVEVDRDTWLPFQEINYEIHKAYHPES
jgi:hypothetical protein